MSKSVIIVGAGIAGLSVGCYAQMNGYRSQIFERNGLPGGLCTSWNRDGYVFDNCIHWLVGSGPGSGLHDAWQELGAVQGRPMVDHEVFTQVVGPDGTTLTVYTDIGRLERHMRELAPEDGARIKEFADLVRSCTRIDLPLGKPRELMSVLDRFRTGMKMLPSAWVFARYGRVSIEKFAARFRNPFLRTAFTALFDLPDFPLLGATMTLAWMHNRTAGYPVGGSTEFIRAIEGRYQALGGQLHYRAPVTEILVEGGAGDGTSPRAAGVRLADGSTHRADYVISAADGHATLYDMLGGRFLAEDLRAVYEQRQFFPPLVRVSLGVARDLSDQPHATIQVLPRPLILGGAEERSISVRHYCYDPTMAEPGKSAVAVLLHADYDHWKALATDRDRYEAEKRQVAEGVLAILEQRLPGIREQVEVVDVATPLTYERYTGNWRGSYEGVLVTTANMTRTLSKTLPGLADFYMVGQWVQPGGGLPGGLMTGREVAQLMCARDGHPFQTSRGTARSVLAR